MAAKKWPSGPPPKEALRFFRAKKLRPGFDYRDVWRAEHATAFTVAKAMEADVLTDIRQGLDQALAEGKTFRQFQAELTPRLQEAGWWGRKEVVDPVTGKRVSAQLGSPRRLRTIYRANMRTARGAGQWERARRTVKARPYAVYRLGPSSEHRPEHVAWEGKVLPLSDPWWRTHWPPNGWGCRCWVRTLPEREARRLGGPHRAPAIRTREWTNRRTGEIERVPEGIDPGWDTNPGRVGRLKAAEKRLQGTQAKKAAALKLPLEKQANPLADFPEPEPPRNGIGWRNEAKIGLPGGVHRARAGYGTEPTGDCVLRAVGNALDADYGRLWRLARQGQKDMFGPGATGLRALKGLRFLRSLRVTPGVRGALVPRWGRDVGEQTITVAEARRRYGSNLILTGNFDDGGPGHMMAVMDAAVVDVIDSRGMRVRAAWKFDRRRLSPQWRAERDSDGLLVQQPPVE